MITSPKVALVEVFYSVQGEGYHAGRPAVFVRLAGCPLACEFALGAVCDTPYQKANLKVSVEDIFEKIVPAKMPTSLYDLDHAVGRHFVLQRKHPMLILTGGEPTASPLFNNLVWAANRRGFYTAVETNATTYKAGLKQLDWRSASPKDGVPQTSNARWHNPNPQSTRVPPAVLEVLAKYPSEYRYVIAANTPHPPYLEARQHYVSPAVLSDGSGTEWKTGFPGFAPGAVERCLEIVQEDPRWHISVQLHKFLSVR